MLDQSSNLVNVELLLLLLLSHKKMKKKKKIIESRKELFDNDLNDEEKGRN